MVVAPPRPPCFSERRSAASSRLPASQLPPPLLLRQPRSSAFTAPCGGGSVLHPGAGAQSCWSPAPAATGGSGGTRALRGQARRGRGAALRQKQWPEMPGPTLPTRYCRPGGAMLGRGLVSAGSGAAVMQGLADLGSLPFRDPKWEKG